MATKLENRDGKKVWKIEFDVKMSIEFETDASVDEEAATTLAADGEDCLIEKHLQDRDIEGEVDYGYSCRANFESGPYECQVNVKGEAKKWRILKLESLTMAEAEVEMRAKVQEKWYADQIDPETAELRNHRIFN